MAFDAAPKIHVPGVLDIIAANQNGDNFGVLLGNGDGTFGNATSFTTDHGPAGIAVGDVNGDGFADVVTANLASDNSTGHHPSSNTLTLYLGNGSGGFTASPVSPISVGSGTGPDTVTVADVNGDGFDDIISGNFYAGSVRVFLSNGDGTFVAKSPVATGAGTGGVATGDFNNDGKLDLAASNFNAGTVSILLGDGSGGFTSSQTLTTSTGPVQVQLGDLNGDGFTDIVVANYNSGNGGGITTALGNGNGTFQTPVTTTVAGAFGFNVAMGDIDNDGKLDLVVPGTSNSSLRVLRGNGAGGFTLAATINTSTSPSFRPESVSLVDLNGDGNLDIVAAGVNNAAPGQGEVYVVLGNGNNTFGTAVLKDTGGLDPNSMVVASLRPVTTAKNTALVFSTGHSNAITVADVDGGSNSETMTLAVKHGTLTLGGTSGLTGVTGNGSGSLTFHGTIANLNTALNGLTYTPGTGYHGTDKLVLTINDGAGAQTTTSSQAIKVGTGTNTAPVAVTDTGSVNEAATLTTTSLTGVVHNDTDVDNDTLTVTAFKNASNVSGTVGNSLAGTYGHLTLNGDGSYSYVADNSTALNAASGTPQDVFTYTISDGFGGTSSTTLTISINLANDAPTLTATALNPTFQEGAGSNNQAAAVSVFSTANAGTIESGQTIVGLKFTVSGLINDTAERAVVDGTNFMLTNGTTGTTGGSAAVGYSVAVSGSTATVTLTKGGGLSAAAADTLINSIGYQNAFPDNPGAGNRVFTLTQIQDSGGTANGGHDTTTLSIGSTVNVVPVNDPPQIDAPGANPTFTEAAGVGTQAAAVSLYTGIAVTTEGSENLSKLTFTVSGLHDGANEKLVFDGTSIALTDTNSGNTANFAIAYAVSLNSGTATVTLTKTLAPSTYSTLVFQAKYQNTSTDNPTAGDRVVTLTDVQDTGGTANGGSDHGPGNATSTVHVVAVDDPATAQNDAFTTDQATAIGAGLSVFVANGSGADSDPDGPALSISAVNGSSGNLGHQITLASGALLTVNADGTFAYNPNHAFDHLHMAAPSSGAANTSTTDSFTYTLAGGNTATVTLTVNGLDNANTIYEGTAGNNTITSDPTLPALFHVEQGGNDTLTGSSGNDGFYFGAAFTGADHVNGGGGTNDQIGLDGDYSGGVILDGTAVTGVEVIAMMPGSNYKLTTLDNFVGNGQTFTFWSVSMGSANHVELDGSAETNGSFKFFLGAGNDIATGGLGADLFYGEGGADHLTGGGGADIFAYLAATDSNGASGTNYDSIDFTAGSDKIQLVGTAVSAVDAAASGSLSVATFDGDLAAVLGNGAAQELDAGHAVVFTATGGDLQTHTFLIVGTSGATSGYAAGADYVFDVTAGSAVGLTSGDFL